MHSYEDPPGSDPDERPRERTQPGFERTRGGPLTLSFHVASLLALLKTCPKALNLYPMMVGGHVEA